MALLNSTLLSLADIARTNYGSEDARADVAELLSLHNPMIDDIQWTEATSTTNHIIYQRDRLPTVGWTGVNQGSPSSKSTQKAVTETMGILEGISSNEEKLLKLGGNENKIRWDQDKAFIEAMAQEFASTFFYGNEKINGKQFTGLANRYNSLSGNIASQVVNANGSGSDNTSIYIVRHGSDALQGIYPKASPSGLQVEDKGRTREKNAAGEISYFKETQYIWQCGIVINNPYNIVRIANIDRSDLNGGSAADLVNLLIDGLARLKIQGNNQIFPVQSLGYQNKVYLKSQTTIYMNRSVAVKLRQQANAKTATGLVSGEAFGVPYQEILGIPVQVCDAILNSETAVS